MAALFEDREAAVGAFDLQATRRDVPLNTTLRAFWLMLMKPPTPDDRVGEAADVDVARRVDLGEGQEGHVETTAIVEVELVGLVDHGVEVLGTAGVGPGQRRAADEALFVAQRDGVENAFLRGLTAETPVEMRRRGCRLLPGRSPSPRGAR